MANNNNKKQIFADKCRFYVMAESESFLLIDSPLTSMHSTTTIPRGHNQMITMNWLSNQLISIVNPSIFRIISWTSSKMQTQQRTNENTFEWRNSRESWPCRWSYSYSPAWKNNARARTSFCVRKKKFFLRLIGGHLGLSFGNRKNFFAVLCGDTLKETRQGTCKWKTQSSLC